MLARVSRVPLLAALITVGLAGCKGDESSNLEKMAEREGDEGAAEAGVGVEPEPTTKADADGGTDVEPVVEPAWPVDANGIPIPPMQGAAKLLTPGADEGRVLLRLALSEGAHYRITTIGMLQLPLIDKPTGFAREEDLHLSDCEGDTGTRSCLLRHEYRNYEAEPPAGSGLEADERQVAGLVTAHRIDASGLRLAATTVEGEAPAPGGLGKQLAELHRMYCIRLPDQPVGLGATWRDVCRMRQGGSLVTRELTWRLAKLDSGEGGKRAELEYAGRVRRLDPKGKPINGEIKGALYFLVDAGEPHLMRERLVFVLDPAKGVSTGTDLRYQFTKVGEGDVLLRTDGEPFDEPPLVLNDPRSVPAGTTRDDELPPDDSAGAQAPEN